MKKKVVKSCLLLVFAMLFAVVAAPAQTLAKYDADIPFDFTIGEETYEAGNYIISLKSPNYLATVLTIRKKKGRDLLVTAVTRNGNRSKKKKSRLVFDRYGDHYILNQVVSPGFGFSAPQSEPVIEVWVEEGAKPKPDTVSLVLRRK